MGFTEVLLLNKLRQSLIKMYKVSQLDMNFACFVIILFFLHFEASQPF